MRHQVYEVHININFIAPLRVSCCCVTDVMLLHCGCCTRLELESLFIQWAFICFCQSSTLSSCGCSSSIHLSLKYHVSIGVWSIRKHLFARCFLPTQTRLWDDFPYIVFDTGQLDGFRGAVNHRLLIWVVFFGFPWLRCLWGCKSNL